MTKTVQERLAALDGELEAKRTKLHREAELLRLLPTDVAIDYFCVFNSEYAQAGITCRVKTRAEVLPILAKFSPAPVSMLKGTFTGFRAEPLTEKQQDRNTITPAQPWTFELSGGRQYGPNRAVKWFYRTEGVLFTVTCEIEQDGARARSKGHYIGGHKRFDYEDGIYYVDEWSADAHTCNLPGAQLIRYWSPTDERGKSSYSFIFWWHRDESATLAQALGLEEVQP